MKRRYPIKPPVSIGEVYEQRCTHCGGNGQEPGLPDLTCRECIGRGRRKWRIEECEACGGSGRKNFGLTKCKDCRGRGWTERDVG
jgi:DnaJ-class molecular chaperone